MTMREAITLNPERVVYVRNPNGSWKMGYWGHIVDNKVVLIYWESNLKPNNKRKYDYIGIRRIKSSPIYNKN